MYCMTYPGTFYPPLDWIFHAGHFDYIDKKTQLQSFQRANAAMFSIHGKR
jgi:hypothetical protein